MTLHRYRGENKNKKKTRGFNEHLKKYFELVPHASHVTLDLIIGPEPNNRFKLNSRVGVTLPRRHRLKPDDS